VTVAKHEEGQTRMDVLLVEDEPAIRDVLEEDLSDAGLAVTPCPTAEDGLLAVGDMAPAVVVTDVNLGPGMDGLALAQELRRRWPEVGLVVMTGDERNLRRMPESLRAVCLMKPFTAPRLVETVNCLMRRCAY
jgi:DNA-binding response OmpR family regulator